MPTYYFKKKLYITWIYYQGCIYDNIIKKGYHHELIQPITIEKQYKGKIIASRPVFVCKNSEKEYFPSIKMQPK